jgi:hypothetical protein
MELLPCPFCGDHQLTETTSFVECDSCLAQALKLRWNTRASITNNLLITPKLVEGNE